MSPEVRRDAVRRRPRLGGRTHGCLPARCRSAPGTPAPEAMGTEPSRECAVLARTLREIAARDADADRAGAGQHARGRSRRTERTGMAEGVDWLIPGAEGYVSARPGWHLNKRIQRLN